jgi:hypothetical protein
MISFQIDQTPQHWAAILRHVESGEMVQLLRGERIVAVLHSPEDLEGWGKAATQMLTDVLKPEDFSDWSPPQGPR